MGADIYLHSIRKRFKAESGEHQSERPEPPPRTSGYFRNSYNDSDVMWAMGLSWWGTVGPMLDANGWLPVQRARELLALLEERPLTDQRLTEHFLRKVGTGGEEPPITDPFEIVAVSDRELPEGTGLCLPSGLRLGPPIDVLTQFLRTRREELIAILRKSIELDEPLDCSL